MNRLSMWVGVVLVALVAAGARGQSQLQKGDYVAVVGDSITEQKMYSVFIEDYLVMCQPAPQLRQTQFGWSGETSWGFERRMTNDMLRFKPLVATTCFGMNDGGYGPMTEEKANRYRQAQSSIVRRMKQAGVRFIVVGSPGCVDVKTFRGGNREQSDVYNKTLASLRDIAREVAQSEGTAFADVYDPMYDVMTRAEAKYGNGYHVAGGDGVHPDANGHLVMAYAFLKGLGCRGEIGTITVNVADNKADATDGHKVLSVNNGSVEIESSRYPFCFYGDDPAKTSSTRGVLEFLPFNQDLNRFMLVVHGAGSPKVKVTWGDAAREFDAAQLEQGVNLAAEFLDTPFASAFRDVEQQIRHKQDVETPLVKEAINQIPRVEHLAPAAKEPLEQAAARGIESDKDLSEAITVSVLPVKHTIKLEPVR